MRPVRAVNVEVGEQQIASLPAGTPVVMDADSSAPRKTPSTTLKLEDKGRGFGAEAAAGSPAEGHSSSGVSVVYVAAAVLCLLVAGAGVVAVVLRRRRLQRQGYADFGSLEMRGYAQWQQDAGL